MLRGLLLGLLALSGAALAKTEVCPPEAASCPIPDFPDCTAGRFISEHKAPGSHLFCVQLAGGRPVEELGQGPDLQVKVWMDNHVDQEQDFVVKGHNSDGSVRSRKQLTKEFAEEFEARFPKSTNVYYDNPLRQHWRIFDVQGHVLPGLRDVLRAGTGFLLEGGQWVWPGVREGFRQRVEQVDDLEDVWIETMSMSPLVLQVAGFLKDGEIERIIETSKPEMRASGVALMDKDKGKPATEWRTSTTHWLRSAQHPWIVPIDRRVSDITRVDITHQEDVQVLQYQHTQKYDAHHDFFSPEFHANDPRTLTLVENGVKNRMSTVFWYMSDVEQGGTTWFPRAFNSPPPSSMRSCEGGLHVAPKKGNVIIFYNMLPNGALDKQSLHGGCPVIKGEKWSANKWVWNKPRD